MFARYSLIVLSTAALFPSVEAHATTCAHMESIVPASQCAESEGGLAIAADKGRARQLLDYAEGGRSKFENAFEKQAPRYAIIESDIGDLSEELRKEIRANGVKVVLPWLSAAGQRAQTEKALRKAVEERMAALGQDEQAKEAAVESAIAQLRARDATAAAIERDSIAIPHELSHRWLIDSYWPEALATKADQYGGPGPDWLDEMAAVIAEPEDAKQRRRELFWASYASDKQTPLTDLRQFFASDHPLAKQARQLTAEARGQRPATGTTVTIVAGEAARNLASSGIGFYLQSLMFSDFLTEISGTSQVFGPIAQGISEGTAFDDWLKSEGARHKLPDTMDYLQAGWLKWLEQKQPTAAKKGT